MQHPIPEILLLSKKGKWWQAQTSEGRVIYSNTKRSGVVGWLLVSGYTDTGDGAHFRHQSLFSEGESAPVLVDVSDSVEQFISERFNALQKEMKQD